MVYQWIVNVDGERIVVEAVKAPTAVYRCVSDKATHGKITFQRGANIRRIKCDICGNSYQDNPESKKHHFEVLYQHKMAVEKSKQDQKVM